jgi:hypothetical protein
MLPQLLQACSRVIYSILLGLVLLCFGLFRELLPARL